MYNLIRLISISIVLLFAFSCQSNSIEAQDIKPEKVYRIVYEMKPAEWYQTQAKLWKQKIKKNPKSEEAWYNFYNANRYEEFVATIELKSKQEKLDKIIDDMEKAIPGTYTFYLLKYWNSFNVHDISLIEKAYAINQNRPDAYYPIITNCELTGNAQRLKEFCMKLYESKDIAPWLLEYNYNVLMSTPQNAILITNGDNDTYPAVLLQQAKGIRTDVTVLNISLSTIKGYLHNKLAEKNLEIDYDKIKKIAKGKTPDDKKYLFKKFYFKELFRELSSKYQQINYSFALTVYNDFFAPLKDDLYIVGLAYQFSKERLDNIALIKQNMEGRLRLDYLRNDWYRENQLGINIMNNLHMNYVPPLIMLAEHYKKAGQNDKAKKWSALAVKIADKADNKKAIEEIKKKGL